MSFREAHAEPVDPVTIGPEHGSLTVHTGVEGKAARAGHALTIAVRDWSATVAFDGGEPTGVRLRAALAGLEVVEGHGGLKPLSDKDKRSVIASALDTLSAAAFPEITFESTALTRTAGGYDLTGEVGLHGRTGSVSMTATVQRAGGTATVQAAVGIEQTAFGIKPYSGMMGALRVSDRVEIRFSATMPDLAA